MYQAVVFFDLDGTLLDDQKNVRPSSIQAIQQLKQNQILPVVATGRNVFEIQYVLDQTGIDSIVSANGSYVQYQGHFLAAEQIGMGLIHELTDFAAEHGEPVAYFNNRHFALNAENENTRKNFKLLRLDAQIDPNFYRTHPVNFINVFDDNRAEVFQQEFKGRLSLVRNNPLALDTMNWGVSKATGINTLLRHAGLQGVTTYCFGDQLNDVEMFQTVLRPIAMGNGNPRVKKMASFVTGDNNHEGIAEGLRHFELIK